MRQLFIWILTATLTTASHADDYPTRAIKIVVPFSPGGPSDASARLIAQPLGEALGTAVVVDNRAGAGGTIGAAFVAKAAPDGYTLLFHHIGLATAAGLYPQLPYDTKTAFAPIGLVNEAALVVMGRSSLPYANGSELVQALKKTPKAFSVAYAGVGSASHLCALSIMQSLGVQLNLIPYKGTGPAMTDVLGQTVDLICDAPNASTKAFRDRGQLKLFLIASSKRLSTLPDVPTASECGASNIDLTVWSGLYAPAGTPKEVVGRLVTALQTALKAQRVKDQFAVLDIQSIAVDQQTAAALNEKLATEINRWTKVFRERGVSLE